MIRNFSRRPYTLPLLTLFIAILIVSTSTVALAQMASAGQLSKTPPDVSMPAGLGDANSASVSVTRRHARKLGARAREQGDPLFLPAVTYDAGGDAYSIAVADVNRDGKPDVVVTTYNSDTVGVLLGNGDGTFQPVHTYYPGSTYPSSIAIADVNGDGKPDLVVANQVDPTYFSQEGVVSVFLGNGDGTFQPSVNYDSGSRAAMSVAVGDVNGDRKLDLLVANVGQVAVLLGNGDGTFAAARLYESGGYYNASIAIADLNHDSKLDLVVTTGAQGTNAVSVLLGNGDGTFQSPVTYDSGGLNPQSVAIADVNGDGRLDVLAANTDSSSVGVLLGNGDGTFQPAVSYGSGGTNAAAIAVADVNGDGKPDLLLANNCGVQACGGGVGVLGVLLGNGDGTFQPAVTYGSGGIGAVSVAAADVNGDSKPDALIANNVFCEDNYCGAGVVGVLLNNYGPHHPTVTTLASSLNPSVFGQTITFTSTVSSSSGTPKGTVMFFDGPTAFGSAALVNGRASFSSSTLPAGSRSITAVYQGSQVFDRSGSPRLNEVVNIAVTTMSLASSLNPAEIGQPVTYTATVTGQYGGAAFGFVSFMDKGKRIGFVEMVGNRATFTTSYKANGTHNISASFPGDANNTGSSASLTEYVRTLPVASKTVLTTSGSPSLVGQSVTFTANVTSLYGSIPDGELVTFYDGATTLGSVALAGGVATYTTSSLSAKSHFIKAAYAGDAIFKKSAGHLWQVVNK